MRRINPARFQVATRGTGRAINSQIVLNLVRTHQPISRADLARAMGVSRATVSLIVNDLIARNLVFEGATGETVRGRKPTFLYIDSRRRTVVAADVRATETFLMLADMLGKPLSGVISFPTVRDPKALVATLGAPHQARWSPITPPPRTARASASSSPAWSSRGRCACCTRRRWAGATWTCASRSRQPRACGCRSRTPAARARWPRCGRSAATAPSCPQGDLVFVSVSEGIGVGVIINGEVLRGRHNIAGEVGHIPLSLDGPRCSCGANGCWEAYISNRATLARYFGRPMHEGPQDRQQQNFTVEDLITRARGGDAKAIAAVEATARYLGLGLASVINVFDPACVYVGGEITQAWDLIEGAGALGAGGAGADGGGGRHRRGAEHPRLPARRRSCRTAFATVCRGAAALVVGAGVRGAGRRR